MAESTVDRLEVEVQAQATKANAAMDTLIDKLKTMSTTLSGLNAGGLKNLASGVTTLSKAVQDMRSVKTSEFTKLASNIEKLGNINQGGITNTANALRTISGAMSTTANFSEGAAQIAGLATSISKLGYKTVSTATSNLPGLASGLQQFVSSLSGIESLPSGAQGIADLANSIAKLGYKSVTNAITNLPLLADGLRKFMQTLSTAPQVSRNLIQMTQAMANLAAQGGKYNATIKSMSNAADRLTRSQSAAAKSSKSFFASFSKFMVGFYLLRRLIQNAFKPIEKAMDLEETYNLFQTSFKKIGMEEAADAGLEWGSEAADSFAIGFVDRSQKFNDKIVNALSLDPDVIMNYQAVFAQMANAFGLTTKSVMNLSESFSMLGLDIASFFNTGVEEAMVKLRAGLAGETEPLRTLGVDITESTLKMIAMKYGIEGTISEMSQAAKTQLRWLAIMEQTETVFGDMAKTIESPSNQVRILQQQFENLSRSIGTVFLPIISRVLPYVNAFVIALRRMTDAIAKALGYEVPDYKDSDIYVDVSSGIDGIGESADETNDKVKKLQKSLAGFDALNNLTQGTDKSSTSGLGAGYPALDDAIAKKTESYMAKFNDEIEKMSNKAEKLADKMGEFFKSISEKSQPTIDALKDLKEAIDPFASNVGDGLQWFYDNVLTALADTSIDYTIPNVLYSISSAISLINTAVDKFKSLDGKDTILGFLVEIQNTKLKKIGDFFKKIGDAFSSLNEFIKDPNWKDLWGYVKNALSVGFDLSDFPDLTDPWKAFGIPKEVEIAFKAYIATTWAMLKDKWESLTKHIIPIVAYFSAKIVTTWNDLVEKYSKLTGKFIGKTVKFIVEIPQKWDDLVDKYSKLTGKFIGKTVKFLVEIPQSWKDISARYFALYNYFVGKTVEFAVKLVTSLGDIKDFVNKIIDSINTSVIAKLDFTIDLPAPIPDIKFVAPRIPRLADGGYVNTGQLFIAREAGPELVGTMNGRTAVANNDQIASGIADAVKGAIVETLIPALSVIGGNNGDTVVIIDNKEVFRATQKAADEYYNLTGRAPYPT